MSEIIAQNLKTESEKIFKHDSKFDANTEREKSHQNPWIKSKENWYDIDSYLDQGRIAAGTFPYSKRVKKNIRALKKLLTENEKVEKQFYKELHALKCKYNSLQTPLYDARAKIISDSRCKDEDGKSDELFLDFWIVAFMNAPLLEEIIEDYDLDVLSYLEDIRVLYSDNGYTLAFYFSENPYFFNSVLFLSQKQKFERIYYDYSTFRSCSNIYWKPGKNVTVAKCVRKMKKGQKRKGKWVNRPSFFNLFTAEGAMPSVFRCIQIADYVKDRMVSRAIYYYTGESLASPYEKFLEENW